MYASSRHPEPRKPYPYSVLVIHPCPYGHAMESHDIEQREICLTSTEVLCLIAAVSYLGACQSCDGEITFMRAVQSFPICVTIWLETHLHI